MNKKNNLKSYKINYDSHKCTICIMYDTRLHRSVKDVKHVLGVGSNEYFSISILRMLVP